MLYISSYCSEGCRLQDISSYCSEGCWLRIVLLSSCFGINPGCSRGLAVLLMYNSPRLYLLCGSRWLPLNQRWTIHTRFPSLFSCHSLQHWHLLVSSRMIMSESLQRAVQTTWFSMSSLPRVTLVVSELYSWIVEVILAVFSLMFFSCVSLHWLLREQCLCLTIATCKYACHLSFGCNHTSNRRKKTFWCGDGLCEHCSLNENCALQSTVRVWPPHAYIYGHICPVAEAGSWIWARVWLYWNGRCSEQQESCWFQTVACEGHAIT